MKTIQLLFTASYILFTYFGYSQCDPPIAICQNVTITLDATGNYTLAASEIDNGSTADCGLQSISLDKTTFDCDDVNPIPQPTGEFIYESVGAQPQNAGTIALAPNGHAYVADINQEVIMHYDGAGNFLGTIGTQGFGVGQFANLRGVAIDASGNIYGTDDNREKVLVFNNLGTFLFEFGTLGTSLGQFQNAWRISVNANGIYVLDNLRKKVIVFNGSGNFLFEFGGFGANPGDFDAPTDITHDASGNIYILDQHRRKVIKYSASGTFVSEFGQGPSGGIIEGRFDIVVGIAIGNNGNIYVADRSSTVQNNKIMIYDNSGSFIYEFGFTGSAPGKFDYVYGVAVDNNDMIYVSDIVRDKYSVFDQVMVGNLVTLTVTDINGAISCCSAEVTVLPGSGCVDITLIPDPNFEQKLISLGIDSDGIINGQMFTADATGVTVLDVSNLSISDLTGIEAFVDLQILSCKSNTLTSLDLSSNVSLTNLNCFNNTLSSLDVSNNVLLEVLQCQVNPLGALDVTNNIELVDLRCSDNGLSVIDVSNNTKLVVLFCGDNNLSALDVTNLTSLELLNCKSNMLASLDVSNNLNLIDLNCFNNVLTSLDVSTNINLQALLCQNNPIGSLDVSNNAGLIDLRCSSTSIGSINLSSNTDLSVLFCNNNSIVSLDLSNNPNLDLINCSNNLLEFLDVRNGNNNTITSFNTLNNSDLDCISVDDPAYSNSSSIWNTNIDPGVIFSADCDLTLIPDPNFEQKLITLGIDSDGIINGQMFTADAAGVTVLDVSNLSISDLTGIEAFVDLSHLFCNNNSIVSLDLNSNPDLTRLYCHSNALTTIDLSNNPNLEVLLCGDNTLGTLDISNNFSLDYLDCTNSGLTALDVSNNINLQRIQCAANSIANIDLSANLNLVILNISSNPISTLDVSNNVLLQTLWCWDNGLSAIDVSNNPALVDLRCFINNISTIDITNCPNLIVFYAYANTISTLDLSSNVNLKYMNVSQNILTFLDMRNGNNTVVSEFNALYNASLDCISVDDPGYSSSSPIWNTNIDAGVIYSSDCSDQDGDGYSVGLGDCDDNNPAINPGAAEKCNGIDDNCNGLIDLDDPGLIDNIPPTFIGSLPSNISTDCSNIPDPVSVSFTDNCEASLKFTQSSDWDGTCSNYDITRTWTITDGAGNVISHVQLISVTDIQAPVFTSSLPGDAAVTTGNLPPAAFITATDNCSSGNHHYMEFDPIDASNANLVLTGTLDDINVIWSLEGVTTSQYKFRDIFTDNSLTTFSNAAYFTPPSANLDGAGFNAISGTAVLRISFDQPVENPVLHINNVDISRWDFSQTTSNISMLSGNDQFSLENATVADVDPTTSGGLTSGLGSIMFHGSFSELVATITLVDVTTDGIFLQLSAADDNVDVTFMEQTNQGFCPYEDIVTRIWQAIDGCGQMISHTQTISVLTSGEVNIDDVVLPTDPTALGNNITVNGLFSDSCDLDNHATSWIWGDGTSSEGSVDQVANTVSGSHLYDSAGVYVVQLVVVNGMGSSDTLQASAYVVIYNPDGGFVTGGGWIQSPAGAYISDPTLSGKANFGFVSKYKKGANIPTGNTQFKFNAAGFNFKSTAYEWLVIAGAKAKYKGDGKVNNQGNFGFMLTAIDGDINGGSGDDKFRIKIWDKDQNELVVYDNKLGSDDTGYDTQILGGGSVTIHSEQGSNNLKINNSIRKTIINNSELLLFPNPTSGKIQIEYEANSETHSIHIIDLNGKVLHQVKNVLGGEGQQVYKWDASHLINGVYFVMLIQDGTVITKKFLVLNK